VKKIHVFVEKLVDYRKKTTFVLKFDMNFVEGLSGYSEEPLTTQVVADLLREYRRPNDKISELIKAGDLIPVKNGLYIPGDKTKVSKPEPFLVANHLRGPSYVSMESALSYWGMIPEKTFEVSSVTLKSAKIYATPVGRFSFFHTALPYYAFGVRSISLTARQTALIASPEKAICDKIIQTSGIILRSTVQTMNFLIEDMRIEAEVLTKLNLKEIDSWLADTPKKSSIAMLIKTLRNL